MQFKMALVLVCPIGRVEQASSLFQLHRDEALFGGTFPKSYLEINGGQIETSKMLVLHSTPLFRLSVAISPGYDRG